MSLKTSKRSYNLSRDINHLLSLSFLIQLQRAFSTVDPPPDDVEIDQFYNGSIIVQYDLVYTKSKSTEQGFPEELQATLEDHISTNDGLLDASSDTAIVIESVGEIMRKFQRLFHTITVCKWNEL